ncbi:uncharacterized protein C18orf19 homolog A [Neoarius graeffei]|uniref:uncharacterized protein C18orf19 homolog A n=1 Tax=Neoarius graeffei TaxID=443677 RepID=UPI00298BD9AA|nr:uncharacterized protein C18orf19 homolog A [Neoarius graeffei]XP_060798403.1 uncharacterized protein C18orf19 homolog A [Neoarius graeffei]XP_060798404.1 uncharacterized protein C18orf19 homolog A [Neoarius graeffei]XP_060798405.1 uncharacterized protein C18orf19 homolog A [Neoarius graeffei]XP_060798406.1 uncharacterized protein C18orf19 homolog A [Neoarius graeffei]XP_060798407.1 uncharacterized protein C18orf19 homolog A [Neoarius graeffei]XP_060798408.1 uncharacterized protein C18orf19
MMRFLCVRELQRFVPLSQVRVSPYDSLTLSQNHLAPGWHWICTSSSLSSVPQRTPPGDGPLGQDDSADPLQDQSMGLAQRFKRTFKQYGKVMIPMHLLTSCMWFSGFYYATMKGVNVVPFLEHVGLPDKLMKLLENSQSGYALTAYAMYKIATPVRYTLTLGGTSLLVKYLRKHGYMPTPPPVKEYLQEKMEETKDRFSEKIEETKDKFTEKLQETKDKVNLRKKKE